METCDWAKNSARPVKASKLSPPPPSLHPFRRFFFFLSFHVPFPKGGLIGKAGRGLRVGPPNASQELFEPAQFPPLLFYSPSFSQSKQSFQLPQTVFPEPIDIYQCAPALFCPPTLLACLLAPYFPLHHLKRTPFFTLDPTCSYPFLQPGQQA